METEQDGQKAAIPDQQQPSPTIIEETPTSQMPGANDVNNFENESPSTTASQPPLKLPHPTMELTTDEFPTYPLNQHLPTQPIT